MKDIIGTTFKTLLVTSVNQAPPIQSCFSASYYGTYDGNRVYMPSATCLEDSADLLISGHLAHVPSSGELLWVGLRAVEASLQPVTLVDEFGAFLAQITKEVPLHAEDTDFDAPLHQIPFTRIAPAAEVLYRTSTSALLAVQPPYSTRLDSFLPRFFKPTLLPSEPLNVVPVPEESIARVRTILDSLEYDETINEIVNDISIKQMKDDIVFLSGESKDSNIEGRYSYSYDILIVADWLQEQMENTGATCVQKKYRYGFAPNLICEYAAASNTTGTVILGSHYDSRGDFGSFLAPGANDDGSGVVATLAIARVIKRKGITFRDNVQLVFFSGEEQGLFGSRYYARDLREEDKDIILMIQADELAYRVPSENSQLAFPDKIGTLEVAQLVGNASALYSPELEVGFTAVCCSDHGSFFDQGYPATHLFERNGPLADPMYHTSGDLSKRPNYEFEQIKLIAKAEFAALLHAAGFNIRE